MQTIKTLTFALFLTANLCVSADALQAEINTEVDVIEVKKIATHDSQSPVREASEDEAETESAAE